MTSDPPEELLCVTLMHPPPRDRSSQRLRHTHPSPIPVPEPPGTSNLGCIDPCVPRSSSSSSSSSPPPAASSFFCFFNHFETFVLCVSVSAMRPHHSCIFTSRIDWR